MRRRLKRKRLFRKFDNGGAIEQPAPEVNPNPLTRRG